MAESEFQQAKYALPNIHPVAVLLSSYSRARIKESNAQHNSQMSNYVPEIMRPSDECAQGSKLN
jgi:hypothetical protein